MRLFGGAALHSGVVGMEMGVVTDDQCGRSEDRGELYGSISPLDPEGNWGSVHWNSYNKDAIQNRRPTLSRMASSTGVVEAAAAILTEEIVVVAKSRRCAIRALLANIGLEKFTLPIIQRYQLSTYSGEGVVQGRRGSIPSIPN